MKTRINSKIKENAYQEYINKCDTYDINEIVNYIKSNTFFRKYTNSNNIQDDEAAKYKVNYHITDDTVRTKIANLFKREKAYLKKYEENENSKNGKTNTDETRVSEKKEKGLIYLYNACENLFKSQDNINGKDKFIIINNDNSMKRISENNINELLVEIIYTIFTKNETLENSMLNLLGESNIDLIIKIIKNKDEIKKDIKLLSKHVDIKENTLGANFFITNTTAKNTKNNKNILTNKENIENIIEYFINNFEDNYLDSVKKIYLPNEENQLEEINVPQNTTYSYSNNMTKVKINRLPNMIFDQNELVSVNALPFWAKYIFNFQYFNYVQSKVFNAAFKSNKNLLVSAPTGCGKTNIALLVILQQLVLHSEQHGINLNKIANMYLIKKGLTPEGNEHIEKHSTISGRLKRLEPENSENIEIEEPINKLEGEDTDAKEKNDEELSEMENDINKFEVAESSYDDDNKSDASSASEKGETVINPNDFKIVYIAPMKSLVFEITTNFREKLKIFNLNVCEYTKEHSLTSKELELVHIIVTVPEKLDILLRNSSYSSTVSDESLIKSIKCIILDEVHLLNTDRGDVIETIVARFLRYSETSQSMKRIMAMSATLPNYKDVSDFLKVERDMCFYFNEKYRSIQLDKTLYGIHETNMNKLNLAKNLCAYNEIINCLKNDKQCIVFVCSRNDTNKTIEFLIDHAIKNDEIDYFTNNLYTDYDVNKRIKKSNNIYIKKFYEYGCAIHHAGMSRYDKILVENLFKKKTFNVLCCTSTLAWGVNLPVHTVIIKGTNFFSSESGKMEDLDILDINQIFGRCGRPQYESHGHAILITERTKLYKYIKLLTNNTIIESNFLKNIENHLNAEISMGTTKNAQDGIKWLEYTYLYIRMKKNPFLYDTDIKNDRELYEKRKSIIIKAISNLSENKLVRRSLTNDFIGTFYGHIAAKYYVDYKTIGIFASHIENNNYTEIIDVISKAKEFENIQIRNEDMNDFIYYKNKCDIKETYDESKSMTVRILIEMYLRRIQINNFSLVCEINYIVQNIIRILYAYYEICLNILKNISHLIINTHNLILSITRRLPMDCGLFRHFCYKNELMDKKYVHTSNQDENKYNGNRGNAMKFKNKNGSNFNNDDQKEEKQYFIDSNLNPIDINDNEEDIYGENVRYRKNQNYTVYLKETAVNILEKKNLSYETIVNLSKSELFFFLRNEVYTKQILYYRNIIPNLYIDGYIQPITQTIMKINLNVQLQNTIWSDQWNNTKEDFHIFLLNTLNNDILYFQKFTIHKKDRKKIHDISFEFPITNIMPSQITVQFLSMNWCNLSFVHIFNTNNLFINQKINVFSEILPIAPLSTEVMNIPNYIKFFSFKYFNPIQTQIFHAAFHTDENILLGAPTGSGKTVIGELCILRNLLKHEDQRSVYICPMKAIVNERCIAWKNKFKTLFNKNVIELTGDKNEHKDNIKNSHIIICTPEKLDVISRNWKNKNIIKNINLIIFDEIHLLGQENRGGVIEILVNRFKNMQNYLNKKIRLVGLTTVITSVDDLILWLDVKENYLFNFPSSCRIVPCKTHILGFNQNAYCPRMSVMNKDVFDSINQYAQTKNVLIFVSSRRQTRLTAYDIISLNLSSHNFNFLHLENLLNDKSHIKFLLNKTKKMAEKKNSLNTNSLTSYISNATGLKNEKMVEYDNDFDQFDYNCLFNKNLSEQEQIHVQNLIFQNYLNIVENEHLKDLLKYGIGIHHAGLNESDKNIVEYFFLNKIIQILICTSTLAWGINLPAYLVIIKGNEYYDPKTKKYKDISYTDLLQMIGRAGRPQFDNEALAILLVHEKRKNAIKNFLYHPMNIESNIMENINEHINAEICSKVIQNKEDMLTYITKSYYFKRLFSNPSYYIKDVQYIQLFENNRLSNQAKKAIYDHINKIIENTIEFLQKNKCIEAVKEDYIQNYYSTPLGYIACIYYTKCETAYFFYKTIEQSIAPNANLHTEDTIQTPPIVQNQNVSETMETNIENDENWKEEIIEQVEKNEQHTNDNNNNIKSDILPPSKKKLDFYGLLELIAQAKEFDDIPLRHNEDKYNVKLRNQIPLDIDMNMPNVKTYLLLLSRFYECTYETVDYHIDLKLVLDQLARVINSYIDISLLFHNYNYIKTLILIFQCVNQRIKPYTCDLYTIKGITDSQINKLKELQIKNIKDLIKFDKSFLYSLNIFDISQINYILHMPNLTTNIKLYQKNGNTDTPVDANISTDIEPNKINNFTNIKLGKYSKNENKYHFKIRYYEKNEILIKVFFSILNKIFKEANPNSPTVSNVQWYAILHDLSQDQSISIKRFSLPSTKKMSTVSFTLEDIEIGNYNFIIYIHSDTYYGLDYEVYLDIQVE
ncbi:DEAD/DEAH helicase, putative [Plasmodium vinckei brucechwatti]|uniref:DEAD/DEAH helicase, putative n=1 Tax=Plasmodium vinckei brucechwatti TaxID=119398 RepID=A0A6V7SL12_PLAVN|nr:DEAD/DEAH helicase, putative [Plasmodium vinckei brucechwatti]